MSISDIDAWFLSQDEPGRSCLIFLRAYILSLAPGITETWNYKMPFYRYQGKRFCYLWYHQKLAQPYIGIVAGTKVNDPGWISEERSRMKIFLINPSKDIPVKKITAVLKKVMPV